MNEKRACSGL